MLNIAKEMPEAPSVHDNHILAYTVSATEKRIVIETEYPHREPLERTNIVFDDVLAYHFERDLFGTIIFDFEEVDLCTFLKERAPMFEDGWRHGWPRGWDKRKEEIEAYVTRLEMRAFELTSSYGMDGWVLAKRMKKESKAESKDRFGR